MTWLALSFAVLCCLGIGAMLIRQRTHRNNTVSGTDVSRSVALREVDDHPESGLLVSESVLQATGTNAADVWRALESSMTPVAVEYRPASASEIARFKTVPVNATAQQALTGLVKSVGPKAPTIYTVVLPKGAELAKAVGQEGFRGFALGAKGIKAQAVLKPVGLRAAAAVSWPAVLIAGSVMALDMAAQAEQRENQRRLQSMLRRLDEGRYHDRLIEQRTADSLLRAAVASILDGHAPRLEVALEKADDVFHRAQLFLDAHADVLRGIEDEAGKADFRTVEARLGGKDFEHFFRELQLARTAISIKRRAIVANAADAALADPTNPYAALQKHLSAQAAELDAAEAKATGLTEQLQRLELKGHWYDRKRDVALHESRIRALAAPPPAPEESEVRILVTPSGEMLQILPSEDDVLDAEIVHESTEDPEPASSDPH